MKEISMRGRIHTAATGLVIAVVVAVALAPSATTPAAAQNRAARPQVLRPDGAVWEVIKKNCTTCHGIDDYAFYAFDRAGWKNLIDTKHRAGSIGAGGADISESDMNLILDWTVEKFGPDSKPFPRAYIPKEVTEFFTDPEANRLIAGRCTACHNIARVNDARNSLDQWRVITLRMRENGAKLNDTELEMLVEWLSRVKGTNANQ
jgi:mono/diheme cytochrome c family protein